MKRKVLSSLPAARTVTRAIIRDARIGKSAGAKSARMERKQQEARRRILEAARAIFMRASGYEKATVREIANRADVSVGAVYLHFKSKPEILAELVNEFLLSVMDNLSGALSPDLSGLDQFRTFFSKVGQFIVNKRSQLFIQLLVRLGPLSLDKAVVDTLASHSGQLIAVLTQIIERGSKDGSLPVRGRKPGLVAVVLFQCLEGLAIFNFGNPQLLSKISAGFTVQEMLSGFVGLASDSLRYAPGLVET